MYGLFYISLLMYKNPMRDILFFQRDAFHFSDVLYVIYYFGTHGLAIYFFLTAGGNPGFADEGSEANIGMHRIFKRERSDDTLSLGSEEEDEENVGFSVSKAANHET